MEDDGENLVDCDVRPRNGSSTDYDVRLRFAGADVANFSASGTLSFSGGELEVDFNTAEVGLTQLDCVTTVETITPGAIWLRTLHCPNLRDPSSPGLQCDGQGGLIFENCDR